MTKYAIAHDGGNGFMKDAINGKRYIFPSVLSRVLPGSELEKVDFEDITSVKAILDNFLDNMDITIQSEGVHQNGRYNIGFSAQNSGKGMFTFNVNSNEGKNTSDISIVSLLALIAYVATKDFVEEKNELPSTVNAEVSKMVTALPIDEIKLANVKQNFIKRFADYTHVVIINNFSKPVTVQISFSKVDVQPEGVIAQLGLIGDTKNPNKFRTDGIFDELKKQYDFDEFTGENMQNIGNVLGIDIGDGTVDFSVLNGHQPVPKMNSSVLMGVGNVAENAAEALHQAYPMLSQINRQAFMAIALRGNDKESNTYRQFLLQQLSVLENLIIEQVKTIYSKMNSQIDMIVFCGGGAVLMHEFFSDSFVKTIDSLSPFGSAPILWIDKQYAQTLNLDGLSFRLLYLEG